MFFFQAMYLEDIEGSSFNAFPIWDTPNPPLLQNSDIWPDISKNNGLFGLRMRYVPLHNVTGLTVCVSLGGVLAISGDDKLEHTPELAARSVFLHFPLLHGEVICSMWIRFFHVGGGFLVVCALI
jgi:hypothetical protein